MGYIAEFSGVPEILCHSEVLASGSMNGFLRGKPFIDPDEHFNRNYNQKKRTKKKTKKKIQSSSCHTALQILHFHRFLEMHGPVAEKFKDLPKQLSENPTLDTYIL